MIAMLSQAAEKRRAFSAAILAMLLAARGSTAILHKHLSFVPPFLEVDHFGKRMVGYEWDLTGAAKAMRNFVRLTPDQQVRRDCSGDMSGGGRGSAMLPPIDSCVKEGTFESWLMRSERRMEVLCLRCVLCSLKMEMLQCSRVLRSAPLGYTAVQHTHACRQQGQDMGTYVVCGAVLENRLSADHTR